MYLTPEAQLRLDAYLTAVRSALAGCSEVDPDEIEQDICAHIASEFPPSLGPVSKLDLEPVLARLGRPEQWVPAGERSQLRLAAERLKRLPAEGVKAGQAALDGLRHVPEQAKRLGGVVRGGLGVVQGLGQMVGGVVRAGLGVVQGAWHLVRGVVVGGLRGVKSSGTFVGRAALSRIRRLPDEGQRVSEAAVEQLHYLGSKGQQASGTVSEWLNQPPDDWRLAYLAFGLLAVGLVIPPLLILLLPASFCVARAAVARARERGEPLGARRWLVYPPLVLVTVVVVPLLLFWPIAPAVEVAGQLWRNYRGEFLAVAPSLLPRGKVDALVHIYVFAAALALWWVVLGSVLWAVPRLAVALFRPFADGFGRRQAGLLFLTGFGILAVCLSLAVHFINSDSWPVHNSTYDRGNYVATVDLSRR